MKTTFSRTIALLCAFILLLSTTFTVSAASAETAELKAARISCGLLTGNFASLADVIEVAEAQMDSSLDDGLSARVDENGQLQIIQVLGSTNNTRSGESVTEIAASSILVLDESGEESLWSDYRTAQGGLPSASIYATHTTHLLLSMTSIIETAYLKCTRMTTVLQIYGTSTPSSLYHHYHGSHDAITSPDYQTSNTIQSPIANTTYAYTPSNPDEYAVGSIGHIETYVHVNIGSKYFEVKNVIALSDSRWMEIIS